MISWKEQLEIESVCDEFEQTLKKNSTTPIEDLLLRVPPNCRNNLLHELLTLEVTYRRQRSEQLDIIEYLKRFDSDHVVVNSVFRSLAPADVESVSMTGDRTNENLATNPPLDSCLIPTGTNFDNYTVLREIGQGGMGTVYLAQDNTSMRLVAMKFVRHDRALTPEYEQLRRRFENEFQAAATLNHENIVPVFASGEFHGRSYYVMPYLKEENLESRILHRPVDNQQAAEITQSIASAVGHAHSRNILHRDIKPANVLFDEHDKPMVADFGMVKWLDDHDGQTATATGMGTPSYMSPEQAQDAASSDARTDVYGIGVTLYAMLTGRPPFTSRNAVTTLKQILDENPPQPIKSNPDVDIDLNTICCKCIEKFPADRYQSCSALEADLSRYLNKQPIQASPTPFTKRFRYWVRRNPNLFAAISAAVLILVFGIAGIVSQWQVAIHNAKIAAENATIAEINLQTARQAVDDYFDVVSQDPELREPNHLPLRKKLLSRCLDYYSEFVNENQNDESLTLAVGQSHLKIGRIYAALGEQEAALESFKNAADILRDFTSEYIQETQARSDLAKSLTNLATFQRRVQKDIDSALANQNEAIRIQSKLINENQTQDGVRSLAKMYNQLSFLFRIQNAPQQRKSSLQQAIHFHQLANQLGQPDLSGIVAETKARMNLANWFCQESQFEEARSLFLDNLHTLNKWNKPVESALLKLIADNTTNLAVCEQNNGDLEGATKTYANSKRQLEQLIEKFPNVLALKKSLRIVYINHGNLLLQNDLFELACDNFEKSLAIVSDLLASSPNSHELLQDRAEDLKFLGLALLGLNKLDEALESHRQALAINQNLLVKNPGSTQSREELATAHKNIATVFVRQNKNEHAINSMTKSIKVLEKLADEWPEKQAYRTALQDSNDWLDHFQAN